MAAATTTASSMVSERRRSSNGVVITGASQEVTAAQALLTRVKHAQQYAESKRLADHANSNFAATLVDTGIRKVSEPEKKPVIAEAHMRGFDTTHDKWMGLTVSQRASGTVPAEIRMMQQDTVASVRSRPPQASSSLLSPTSFQDFMLKMKKENDLIRADLRRFNSTFNVSM